MKKIISLITASLMLLTVASCGKTLPEETSVTASDAEKFITDRIGAVPEGVIVGDAETAGAYGVDMSDFEDEGYIVRTVDDKTLVFGKTDDGLDRAARYYVNHVYGSDVPADKTYGEGDRVESFTVCGRDISGYVIIVTAEHPEGSYPESTNYAASELSSVIKQATGETVPVVEDAGDRPYIRLTCDGSGDNGEEGFTVTVTDEGNIEILGGIKRGCLYAVYDIAEKWLGMRFVTVDYTYIYEQDHVNITTADSYSDAPGIALRNPYCATLNKGFTGFAEDSDFSAKNKLHTNTGAARFGYTPVMTANHGLYEFWECAASDPNPCTSDEELFDLVIQTIRTKLETAKTDGTYYNGDYYHVNLGQNDTNTFCHCDKCEAVAAEEGSYGGVYARYVKAIADTFAEEYPEVRFCMLAYWGTEKAPKVTKLPDNVYVTYCITGSCYCGPMDGSDCREGRTGNSGFTVEEERENLLGWNEVTDNLTVWIYYFSYSLSTPKNVMLHMYKDIQYLYGLGVRDLFVEFEHTVFSYDIPGTWLLSKLLWDPHMSEDEFISLRDEIMWLTYGDGYDIIIDQLYVYDRMFPCEDSNNWGTAFDYEIAGAEAEYLLLAFGEAERLADCARAERNVQLISAHAKYNVLCGLYRKMYLNGTDEEKAQYDSLRYNLRDFLLVGRIADNEAVFLAVFRHPLTFLLLHHFVIHARLFRPIVRNDITAESGLVIAGAGFGHPAVVPAVVLLQAVVVHCFLRAVAAVRALEVHILETVNFPHHGIHGA